jgi:hypothetical protein
MSEMKIKYIGRKGAVAMSRPEMEKSYDFPQRKPVVVTRKDGAYLCREFPRSFEEAAPAKETDQDTGDQDTGPETSSENTGGEGHAECDHGEDDSEDDPGTKDPVDAFIESVFPGQTIKTISKDEIEAECLKVTDGKVNLKKNKSVVNMLKDFMEAVK